MSEQSSYQGYSSRETYDVSLWLNNDQGYYETVREMANEARESATEYDDEGEPVSCDQDEALYSLRDAIEDYWDDITDPDAYGNPQHYIDNILPMVKDVGSTFRVDWTKIAKEFLSE